MDAVALCWRRGIEPREVALAVVRAPAQLARLADVTADLDAPLPVRIVALAAVVEAVAIGDLPVPASVADAIDDLALVDAAVAAGRAGAVCAALHGLGPRPELRTTRRRVVRRLIAAGASGLPLAGLALAIGDLGPGATLAGRDFDQEIAPRLARLAPDPIAASWTRWLTALSDDAMRAVLVTLGSERAAALIAHAGPAEHARISSILAAR